MTTTATIFVIRVFALHLVYFSFSRCIFLRQEIIFTVMMCLKNLAGYHVQLSEASIEGISSKTTWRNIWLATLRTCSSHGLQDGSFQLLESIVKVTTNDLVYAGHK